MTVCVNITVLYVYLNEFSINLVRAQPFSFPLLKTVASSITRVLAFSNLLETWRLAFCTLWKAILPVKYSLSVEEVLIARNLGVLSSVLQTDF